MYYTVKILSDLEQEKSGQGHIERLQSIMSVIIYMNESKLKRKG